MRTAPGGRPALRIDTHPHRSLPTPTDRSRLRGPGAGSGLRGAASAPVRPGGPRRACPERVPPAGGAGEWRGAPAAAPLLKAKAGAPRGVLERLPANRGRETRRAQGRLWNSRCCYRRALFSHLMAVFFCSNVLERCGGFQKVAVSWAG